MGTTFNVTESPAHDQTYVPGVIPRVAKSVEEYVEVAETAPPEVNPAGTYSRDPLATIPNIDPVPDEGTAEPPMPKLVGPETPLYRVTGCIPGGPTCRIPNTGKILVLAPAPTKSRDKPVKSRVPPAVVEKATSPPVSTAVIITAAFATETINSAASAPIGTLYFRSLSFLRM